MKTSWNDIHETEQFLLGKMTERERASFRASLLSSPEKLRNFRIQKKIFSLLRFYRREKVREDLVQLQHEIFNDPLKSDFKASILSLFKS
jgi:hypothetical protein